jgi:hypothetical protein
LLHQFLPKIDFGQEHSVIFTPTPSSVDELIKPPAFITADPVEIFVLNGTDRIKI